MQVFFCAGEPSGDLHGANLIRALKQLHPGVECIGFGGERMEVAGCRLIYPLCELAVMWLGRVLIRAPLFLELLSKADRWFRHHRPDAVVLIDYPGFNWWLARRAHFHKIPVFYFVPPQLWAWAGWRVSKMRRFVDHVLCSLPFEEKWYQDRGVDARYIGHPYFDELSRQKFAHDFLTDQQSQPGRVVGILPGSRDQEVERNLPTLLRAAERIHSGQPDTRFLVACFKEAQRRYVISKLGGHQMPLEAWVGRTPEIIHLSQVCMAVSGSVGLELLYQEKPSLVVYRVAQHGLRLSRWLMTARHISLVNLLAGKELYPEFLTDHCVGDAMAGVVLGWLKDENRYLQIQEELADLRSQVAKPGACVRAATYILRALNNPAAERRSSAA
jgi:lipid-A-disaccharide synthase